MIARLGRARVGGALFIFLLWSLSTRLWAGTVTGELDKSQGSLEDQFIYTLSVQGSLDGEPEFPAIDGLSVERAGTSQSVSIINGKFSREVQYQFALTPNREGKFQIPPLRVKIDGKWQETLALELDVKGGASGGEDEASAEDKGEQPVFIERSFSRERVYVGEPVLVRTRIFHRVKLFAAEPELNYPSSFQVRNIDDQKNYSQNIGGREFNVSELNAVLTPSKEGQYTIDPAILNAKIGGGARRRPRSWLDDWMSPTEMLSKRFRSAPAEIEVLALPLAGRRDDFSGLVGRNFEISPEISKRSIQVGETVTLTLSIKGLGSTAGMADPELKLGDLAKVYKDKPQSLDQIDLDAGIRGERVLKYAIVPTRDGKLDLGSLRLQVFDSESGQYRDLVAELGTVEVSGEAAPQKPALAAQDHPAASEARSAQADRGKAAKPQVVASLGEDLVELHGPDRVAKRDQTSPLEWAAGGFLSLGGLLLLSSSLWRQRQSGNQEERAAAKRKKEALKQFDRRLGLATAQLRQNQSRAAVLEAQAAMKEYFGAKFGTKASALTFSEILVSGERHHLAKDSCEAIKAVGQDLDRLLYAPGNPEEDAVIKIFARLEQLMQEVEKQC